MGRIEMIWELIEGILAGAGLMAFIIFGRWNHQLSKVLKEQKKASQKE